MREYDVHPQTTTSDAEVLALWEPELDIEVPDLLPPLMHQIEVLVAIIEDPEWAPRKGIEGNHWEDDLFLIEEQAGVGSLPR